MALVCIYKMVKDIINKVVLIEDEILVAEEIQIVE